MAGHLGAGEGEVHAGDMDGLAQTVLDFWFVETPPEKRFAKDPALDAQIAARFGALRQRVLAERASGWRDTAETVLAAIILLDQFSRNLFRGDAAAFAADPLALELAYQGIARGWQATLRPERAAFLLMPLMHAEDRAVQAESVARFRALGEAENLAFAIDHARVIEEFGRFPSRNAALGRPNTPAERDYLSRPGAGW